MATITCPKCNGSGTYGECGSCSGTGSGNFGGNCSTCKGTGKKVCPLCEGEKVVDDPRG